MRAPAKKYIKLPSFRGVPDYTDIERACRNAGEIPKSDIVNRTRAFNRIAKLFSGDINDRDLRAVVDFLCGRFDLKPGSGRPVDLHQQFILIRLDERVQQVRREEHCSLNEAIRQVLDDAGVTDPAARRRVRNYIMKR